MHRSFSLLCLFALLLACDCDSGDLPDAQVDVGADTRREDVAGDTNPDSGPGAVGAACANSDACSEGLICAAGTCEQRVGMCSSDADCSGDSYCCATDCTASGESGGCLRYGTGPRGNINPMCEGMPSVGVFAPSVQCEWSGPPEGDPYPDHTNVLTTPLVANLGNDPGTNPDVIAPNEILIVTYNFTDGGALAAQGTDDRYFGVIRILNGQTCEQLESIAEPEALNAMIAASTPTIGDLDNDGVPEIVTNRAKTGLLAWKWNPQMRKHERYWVSDASDVSLVTRWDGPSLYDLNDDGFAEVLSRYEVYDGRTGMRLNDGQMLPWNTGNGGFSIVEDVDGDGEVELVAGPVYRWDRALEEWTMAYPGLPPGAKYAVADFGTPGAAGFDATVLDGIAEIVSVLAGVVRVGTLQGDLVFEAPIPGGGTGGPPTIGDFDNDGFPEVATAGRSNYAVFDIDCEEAGAGCIAPFVRWSKASQDASSNQTGSSIFDFEGDGQAEAVYADECYSRIYDGQTGEVLYSAFRTSCTWYENPVVADPDSDQNTEILVNSNANCAPRGCAEIDPIHPGTRCLEHGDCQSGTCNEGFCRCVSDEECRDGDKCVAPLPDTPGTGNTCRASHPEGETLTGLRVLRDQLDRWVSSRPIWNQHAYSVTNVNDDGSIPRTSERARNVTAEGLNNYRQNIQGKAGLSDLPDITGRLDDDACRTEDGAPTRLVSTVCNRGNRSVGAALPATFYLGDPADGNVLCVSYTNGAVPRGGCLEVSCELSMDVNDQDIVVVVNDDGSGGATTLECNTENNRDMIRLDECLSLI